MMSSLPSLSQSIRPTPPLMDSTMYFLSGEEMCGTVSPAFRATSSNCGSGLGALCLVRNSGGDTGGLERAACANTNGARSSPVHKGSNVRIARRSIIQGGSRGDSTEKLYKQPTIQLWEEARIKVPLRVLRLLISVRLVVHAQGPTWETGAIEVAWRVRHCCYAEFSRLCARRGRGSLLQNRLRVPFRPIPCRWNRSSRTFRQTIGRAPKR